MKITTKSFSRREQILETLVDMLEANPGIRVTTASLANAVGITEAAIYRHFPSKAKIFESLVINIEQELFNNMPESPILEAHDQAIDIVNHCEWVLKKPLQFSRENPGICSLMCGNVLVGEHERLKARVNQVMKHFEHYIHQLLEMAEHQQKLKLTLPVTSATHLLITNIEGRLHRFIRSDFKLQPLVYWENHWQQLVKTVFDLPG